MTKTNSSVPYNSPHLTTSQTIHDYVLFPKNYVQHTSIRIKDYVHIVYKKAKTSIPDSPSLKDVIVLPKLAEWKKAMQIQ